MIEDQLTWEWGAWETWMGDIGYRGRGCVTKVDWGMLCELREFEVMADRQTDSCRLGRKGRVKKSGKSCSKLPRTALITFMMQALLPFLV